MPSAAALVDLQTRINRRFGAGTVLGAVDSERPTFSGPSGENTGRIAGLEILLGPAGIPKGRLTEIFGARSSGKTSLAFAALAACTRSGECGAYIDPRGGFFAPAAANAGIDLRRLIVVRLHDACQARRAVDALVRGGACAVVVFDCSDLPNALQAHHCTRLVAQAEKTGTTLLVVSSGGAQAIASFASLRLQACGLSPLWQEGSDGGSRLLGCAVTIEVAKARMVVPRQCAAFQMLLPDVAGTWPA